MTNEKAEKIVRGIEDKIECNTVDIDDWAEFWGFTREEYEEFLDIAIKASEQLNKSEILTGSKSEDAISRTYIESIVEELENICINGDEHILSLLSDIKNAPSVTPSYNSIKTELEPCEDFISREAVKNMLTAEWTKYMPMESDVSLSFVLEKISELPSVTPKQRIGKEK